MAEYVKCKLEVVAAPTFSISAPVHVIPGVIGDSVSFTIDMSAIGAFTDDVTLEVADAPDGAVVTYDPVDATIAPGESLEITIDTTECEAGIHDITVQEAS